jgi:hypothetical protein
MIEETQAKWDAMFVVLNRLRETTPDARKFLLVKATDITTSINDQRLQIVATEQFPVLALHDDPSVLGVSAVLRLWHACAGQP